MKVQGTQLSLRACRFGDQSAHLAFFYLTLKSTPVNYATKLEAYMKRHGKVRNFFSRVLWEPRIGPTPLQSY